MTLPAGNRIGPYEIVAPIGAGGMGEVYRARDSRLARDVAIKILPPSFAADVERVARFDREARALASLNHPNIAQIYGVEAAQGATALVMELVAGDDLTAAIARGPMPLAAALPIAQQIADALEAAHERGIIHRDLKPGNIKLSADGAVKVLDFGLAKAIDGSDAAADPLNSPTMSLAGTRAGVILGTAAYMAPEQARGQTVDRRGDIWAFGIVLFEMLSGRQAFSGETVSDVLASVLKNDLDWTALPKDLPAPILSLLRRCLNPDRRNRLRDIGEARVAIADYLAHPAANIQPGRISRGARMQTGALALTSIALVLALAALAYRGKSAGPGAIRLAVAPPAGVSAYVGGRPSIAVAPDGWTIAFVGVESGIPQLYLRGAEDFDARKIADTDGAGSPVFSPNGRVIAFQTNNWLKTVTLAGGSAQLTRLNDPRGLDWADDATIVFTPESIGGLMEMAATGGTPRVLTSIDEKAGERTHRWPHVLPGGQWVLFTVGTSESPDNYDQSWVDAVNRQTGERRRVLKGASMARYAASGHLIFSHGATLYAVPFDPTSLKVSGTPVSVVPGIGGDWTTGAAHVAWSADGTFAYVPGDQRGGMRQLEWSDLKGARQSIRLPPSLYNDIRISPDGTRVAIADGTSGVADIWVYTFARDTYTRLTFTGVNASPVWSADGREVYFAAVDQGVATSIMKTSADGGRAPVVVMKTDVRAYLKHVSADGSWALIDYVGFRGARSNIARVTLQTGAALEPLADARADEYGGALSRDGRFMAYQSDESGRPEIYVRELGQAGGRWQISNAGGEEPAWSPDGRSLYFRYESRLMHVAIDAGARFQYGVPALLFDGVYNLRSDTGVSYHPHPDGKRLLMSRPGDVTASGSVRIVTRWFDQLRSIK